MNAVHSPAARIDLHAHTTASDGTDSPTQLVAAAHAAGLTVLGLTDHDTTAGWSEASAAVGPGLTLVPGAELSCEWRAPDHPDRPPVSVHLLAYLFDPDEPELRAELRRVRDSRVLRGERIVQNLIAAGVPVSWTRVRELAADATVGRPHIARALVEAGVVATVDDAFGQFLHEDSPYYAGKEDIEVRRAITLVRRAGGVAVLAHPFGRSRGAVVDGAAIRDLAQAGLAGLEVDHVDHSPQDRDQLRGLAAQLGLVVTGASDFHGRNKEVRLGDERTDPGVYDEIVAQATGTAPVVG